MPVRHDLTCPDCGASMELRTSRFGKFYGCTAFPKCKGTHGAHADGTPLGIPASKPVKDARIRAHAAFDKLWKFPTTVMSRSLAYAWMAHELGLSAEDAHIGRFDISTCERLIVAVQARLKEPPLDPTRENLRQFWDKPDVADPSEA